nr:hypothetical protein CFP56_19735 [Quercus suber]
MAKARTCTSAIFVCHCSVHRHHCSVHCCYIEPILKTSHPVATSNLKTHRRFDEEPQPLHPSLKFEGSTRRGEELQLQVYITLFLYHFFSRKKAFEFCN